MYSCSFQNDQYLVSAGDNLLIWDLTNSKLIHELKGHEGTVQHFVLSQSETELYTAGIDKTIKIWNLLDFSMLYKIEA
jgi:WD40 repeat protein